MGDLAVRRTFYKQAAASVGERLGRLKPNGRIVRRSPLSSVLELEVLCVGVTGKRAGWRTLRSLADVDARLDTTRLDRLLQRADDQLERIEHLRVRAAGEAFGRAE